MENSMATQAQFRQLAKELAVQMQIAPKDEHAKFIQAMQKTNSLTNDEYKQLTEDIENGVRSVRHFAVEVIVNANGQNKIKLFDEKLTKIVGIRSLSNAKLPKDVVFVPNTLQILTGVAASASTADVLNTDFVGIHTEPVLAKGELKLGFRGNKLMNGVPTSIFDTRGKTENRTGEIVLSQTIVFPGDKLFEGEIEVEDFSNINPLTYIKITLTGMAAMSIA